MHLSARAPATAPQHRVSIFKGMRIIWTFKVKTLAKAFKLMNLASNLKKPRLLNDPQDRPGYKLLSLAFGPFRKLAMLSPIPICAYVLIAL